MSTQIEEPEVEYREVHEEPTWEYVERKSPSEACQAYENVVMSVALVVSVIAFIFVIRFEILGLGITGTVLATGYAIGMQVVNRRFPGRYEQQHLNQVWACCGVLHACIAMWILGSL